MCKLNILTVVLVGWTDVAVVIVMIIEVDEVVDCTVGLILVVITSLSDSRLLELS